MSLHIRCRPRDFDEFYGNNDTVDALLAVLKRDDPPHSYLFVGPSGTGKTTLGRLLKKYLKIEDADYAEYDAANTRGIKTIREVIENCGYAPMIGSRKLYLFDECHQLTTDAQEAILKTIEKPPDHVYIALCTTEPEKLKATLVRRPNKFMCKPLLMQEMKELLEDVCEAEGKESSDEVLDKIISVANGSPGIALNLLDTVIDLDAETGVQCVTDITHDEISIVAICQTLINKNISPSNKWEKIKKILPKLSDNHESNRRGILSYMTKVHLGRNGSLQTLEILGIFEKPVFNSGFAGIVIACHLAALVE